MQLLLPQLCIFCLYFGICLGSGKVSITLLEYDNPGGLWERGLRCDPDPPNDDPPCDHYFKVCLDHPKGSLTGVDKCNLGKYTTAVIETKDYINFNDTKIIQNPKELPFKMWMGGALLKVQVMDQDETSEDDKVDFLTVNVSMAASELRSESRKKILKLQHRTKLTIAMEVYCDDGWYGSQCNCLRHDAVPVGLESGIWLSRYKKYCVIASVLLGVSLLTNVTLVFFICREGKPPGKDQETRRENDHIYSDICFPADHPAYEPRNIAQDIRQATANVEVHKPQGNDRDNNWCLILEKQPFGENGSFIPMDKSQRDDAINFHAGLDSLQQNVSAKVQEQQIHNDDDDVKYSYAYQESQWDRRQHFLQQLKPGPELQLVEHGLVY